MLLDCMSRFELFQRSILIVFFFFFFSSRRRHTRCREVSWARRCVQETGHLLFDLFPNLHNFSFHSIFGIDDIGTNSGFGQYFAKASSYRIHKHNIPMYLSLIHI
eukprot:TRINITY_DN7779_c0_g1_i1.p2 TRINITY_DN7779_c0_g1~~TRINITY_DN7779_c0_g1_i1.p2  ORF type:complete len:105 (-),score=35.66 TRINITY_DN7779_c0_g1_i1:123-437(-)